MRDEKNVGHVYEHVQALPHRRRNVPQPEIVACGRHQKQDHESGKSELLKREIAQAEKISVGDKEAHQGVFVAEAMELHYAERSMNESEQKRHDSEMASVVEQRKKTRV